MTTSDSPLTTSVLGQSQATSIPLDPAMNAAIRARVMEAVDVEPELQPRPLYTRLKRVMDVTVSLSALLLASPLMAAIAALIRLDSRGPILFRQERLGKDGRPFFMLKFRSMHAANVEVPAELLQHNEASGPLFKMRRDPRITRVGRLLRRASLDELPQLFNILKGEMSLVGPRPPLPRELSGFENAQRLRLRVVPGLTGLWQVSGRSNLTFDEMVRLDCSYIEQRSIWLDIKIILKTIPSVLFAHGAY